MPRVKELMTKTVLTATQDTPFYEVVNVFVKSGVHHLPIINSKGAIRAMVSTTDALKAIHEMDEFHRHYSGFSLEKKLDTRDEMSSDVVMVDSNVSVREAVELMVENDIHALPVTFEERVVGIITSNDILKAVHKGKLIIKDKDDYQVMY